MRFPVPDSRRNGKSHIPGPAVFTRELSAKEKAGDLIVRLSCHSFGFAASAHKPAILSNRNIKTILYNLQVKTRSQRGRDRRLQPLTSLRSFCLAASSRCLAKVRKRPLGLDTLLGSSWRLGHSCNAAGESSQAGSSTAERRGGKRSRPRWLSAAASVRRGWLRAT